MDEKCTSGILQTMVTNTSMTSLNLGCEELEIKSRETCLYVFIYLFTGNDIGAQGAKMAREVLKANTTLTALNLSRNK